MKTPIICLLFFIGLTGIAGEGTKLEAVGTEFAELAWLAGNWAAEDGSHQEIHWMHPRHANMPGMWRVDANGEMRADFFLVTVTNVGSELFLWRGDSGSDAQRYRYKVKMMTDDKAAFTTGDDTFPENFTFRKLDENRFELKMDGLVEGKKHVEKQVFKRASL